jgi:hypothetical protein
VSDTEAAGARGKVLETGAAQAGAAARGKALNEHCRTSAFHVDLDQAARCRPANISYELARRKRT